MRTLLSHFLTVALVAAGLFPQVGRGADTEDVLISEIAAAETWIASAYPSALAREAATAKLKRLVDAPKSVEERLAALRAWRKEQGVKPRVATTAATSAPLPPAATLAERTPPSPGVSYTLGEIKLAMRWIPGGAFVMGTPHATGDESPVGVTVSSGYWMGATEVTQAQWRAIMGTSPSKIRGDGMPVEQVSWFDAMAFCRKLTEAERAAGRLPAGYAYTLPTEAEWEYACRAGSAEDHADELAGIAWYQPNSGDKPHPVALKLPNAWGLYDMHGNVWEWTYDYYAPRLHGGADPIGPTAGRTRVLRGGCWCNEPAYCRFAYRYNDNPEDRADCFGFRIALSAVPRPR